MKKTEESPQRLRKPTQGKPVVGSSKTEQMLEKLRSEFLEFRRTHKPGTTIPNSLRAAAIGALHEGVDLARVRKACRITSEQLAYWMTSFQRTTAKQPISACGEPAHVFPVIRNPVEPTEAARPEEADAATSSSALELRIAGFAISIRSQPAQ